MEVEPIMKDWGYPVNQGYFSLRVVARLGLIKLQYTLYGETEFSVSVPFYDTDVVPTTPLSALSRVLSEYPGLLEREDVRALRDYLLAQPGALRAGS